MPRESLDAPEDLPKEGPRQVAFGQLQDEVPRMPDPATGLEEALLEARQGPALDGEGQDKPAHEIAEEEQAFLVIDRGVDLAAVESAPNPRSFAARVRRLP